jgi:hypothetical protein
VELKYATIKSGEWIFESALRVKRLLLNQYFWPGGPRSIYAPCGKVATL